MFRVRIATIRATALLATIWLGGACGSTPTITPSGDGPYVHADSTSGGTHGGLAHAPGAGVAWPPASVPSQPGACTNEQQLLEHDLDVTPVACPAVERVRGAPAEGDADAPVNAGGFQLTCYQLETRILVVEYEHTGTLCTHIVGLALFKGHP